jgi:transcription elongation GreA/GreB family factor
LVEDRIKKIESILKNAVIVSSHKTELVNVGAVITVVKEGDKNEKIYTIVGGEESDIATGKISINSPFGQAAMGKKKGEKFTFKAPAGPVTYKIIEIK